MVVKIKKTKILGQIGKVDGKDSQSLFGMLGHLSGFIQRSGGQHDVVGGRVQVDGDRLGVLGRGQDGGWRLTKERTFDFTVFGCQRNVTQTSGSILQVKKIHVFCCLIWILLFLSFPSMLACIITSIQCQDLNPRPPGCKCSSLTNRSWLLSKVKRINFGSSSTT